MLCQSSLALKQNKNKNNHEATVFDSYDLNPTIDDDDTFGDIRSFVPPSKLTRFA